MKIKLESKNLAIFFFLAIFWSSYSVTSAIEPVNLTVSPCDTVRREIKSGTFEDSGEGSGPGTVCTKFTIGVKNINEIVYETQEAGLIEKYRDRRSLIKKDITTADSAELTDCGQKANDLAVALTGGKFESANLPSPIRESFSTISFKYASSVRYYTKSGKITGLDNQKYYFDDSKKYIDFLPTDNFANYKYGQAYAGDYICRIHLNDDRNGVTGFEIRRRPTHNAGASDWKSASQTIDRCSYTKTRISCDHRNAYDYGFEYQMKQSDGSWTPACGSPLHKCEDIRLKFALTSEWFAGLIRTPAGQNIVPLYDDLISPPTDIKVCTDQANCLSAATEKSLTENTWGKGVQRVPDNFIGSVENSLLSGKTGFDCENGICVSLISGKVPVSATIPANQYYGQCRGFDRTINTPVAEIPQNKATSELNIVNRPPSVTVSLAKNQINLNEEVEARCDIVDPDSCVDKIAKVRWQCFNDKNESVSCFFAQSSEFKEGQLTEEIPTALQTNPYRSTVKFKASKLGNYSITCEAWDTDAAASASGIGLGGITVCENCGGVIPASNSFCAVVMSDDRNQKQTACENKASFLFEAYNSNIQAQKYLWKCKASDSTSEQEESPTKECFYEEGSYIPALSIIDKSGKEHKCLTNVDVRVSTDTQCKIKVKSAESLKEAGNNLTIARGKNIEARIESECAKDGILNWEIPNAVDLKFEKNGAYWSYPNSGTFEVRASLKIGEKEISCEPARIEVSETLNIGTH